MNLDLDVPRYNGDDSWSLPLPARYVIRPDGIIHHAAISTDHTVRPDPSETMVHLRNLGL